MLQNYRISPLPWNLAKQATFLPNASSPTCIFGSILEALFPVEMKKIGPSLEGLSSINARSSNYMSLHLAIVGGGACVKKL